ncbi:hypothetical protein [Paenarthrobacter ilicis]|uniref:Uncharacterized protein n=1 Tax=Paenarthrobacter ilicis TaxID=43665 RepID=A0ABX0THZ1_9MICC|nr:hypothetical protein [Paenarthrobacter ilicis]MBM7792442.1 hypothetical protein [Paenarthrobacter ilicis]NIJ00786.1 hypothetical protein [Paenarthrobacter ilicis]
MSAWHPYDGHIIPAFYERFEKRWGRGTAPFLDPEVLEQPMPRAQWINPDTGAAVAVVPIWTDDPEHRSFGVFYLPPAGDIWMLRPGPTTFLEPKAGGSQEQVSLRNDAFKKAVHHAKEFIYGPQL